ncbi:AIPR family protein [Psychroserpens sp. Hel_I_66]|uniref:AIPR family protein n=1 Tax=Psychroserpens sp. Hel_I_66 TaxID=1250004 RepID=UPI000645E40B|nr:AIPR family protein [Psychroserpens sp. Hel_I_66]
MAKNDKILIDGIIDERIELNLPSNKRDEAFEYFSFEQILKDYDLSSDEIKNGSVDGRNDGGIDGFFILVNGHCLQDPLSFNWPKSGSILELWIITCKHHDTFRQAPLDNLVASMTELLDFSIENKDLKVEYIDLVLKLRENLKFAYRKVSPRLSEFSINFCYASRGNSSDLGDSIVSRSEQLIQVAQDSFGNCVSKFHFFGATELIDLNRKIPNFTLELPFKEALSSGERYVLLVNLNDYFNFVSDNNKLRRYLFDSNVRDFMGLNRVNEDIKETLKNLDSPDFWWLNNGVTILATGASVIGKSIQIQDIQIVNGLQTTESIFRHFQASGTDPKNRSVMVKIIVSNEDEVRDTIIRATNNQTNVELASLHATDKIQRDIEDVLKLNEIYYERRTNYYKNQGIPVNQIVTPLYLASGFINFILKSPHQATMLKSRFMRSESSYNEVFSLETDLKVWPKIAEVLKKTDTFLETVRPGRGSSQRFLKTKRQFLSFLVLSKSFGTFNFSVGDLISLDILTLDNTIFEEAWELLESVNSSPKTSEIKRKTYLIRICEAAKRKWSLKGYERMKKGMPPKVIKQIEKNHFPPKKNRITLEFAMKVNDLLPPQPWKPNVELEIIKTLKCHRREYFDAVAILIEEGIRNYQKDGVVYDQEGNVLSFDKERVDSETLELFRI